MCCSELSLEARVCFVRWWLKSSVMSCTDDVCSSALVTSWHVFVEFERKQTQQKKIEAKQSKELHTNETEWLNDLTASERAEEKCIRTRKKHNNNNNNRKSYDSIINSVQNELRQRTIMHHAFVWLTDVFFFFCEMHKIVDTWNRWRNRKYLMKNWRKERAKEKQNENNKTKANWKKSLADDEEKRQ